MTITRRCIVLFSGGLDSMLAVRILQAQGVAVEALNFKTIFTCCQDQAGQAARRLGVPLTVVSQEDDYLDLIRHPRFGYGKGANPCVDCRIYMFRRALRYMRETGADFLASGEILGQRPMSQKRKDLEIIAYHSAEDLLLRPLSAKALPPTLPEREGWVDRSQLYEFRGRGRRRLIELARQFGIEEIPSPSTGCALTEPKFSQIVHDLIQLDPGAGRWDFELLNTGRHFRFDEATKAIVGRHAGENAALEYALALPAARRSTLLRPIDFAGPTVMLLGDATPAAIDFAVGLIVRYAGNEDWAAGMVEIVGRGERRQVKPRPSTQAAAARTLADTASAPEHSR